jgi:hypothetical protein
VYFHEQLCERSLLALAAQHHWRFSLSKSPTSRGLDFLAKIIAGFQMFVQDIFNQQIHHKGDITFPVVPLGNYLIDLIVDPVVGAKNVAMLFGCQTRQARTPLSGCDRQRPSERMMRWW